MATAGKAVLYIQRTSTATQTITISSSVASATVPAPTGVWHRMEVDVGVGDKVEVSSFGTAKYYIAGKVA